MAQNLIDLVIEEISLVDDGANEGARVVIAKARDASSQSGGNPDDNAADEVAKLKEFEVDIENLSKALEDAEAKLEALEKRTADAEAAAKDADTVIKAKDAEIESLKKGKPKMAKAEGEEEEEEDEEEVMKSLPESIRKRLAESDARAKVAEEQIAKARDEAEKTEAIAKAKELKFGKAEEIGPLLLRVRKGMTTADDAATLERMFKAAGEQGVSSALFKSMGSGQAVEGDPESILKAKAEEIKKATGSTYEQAYAKALEANPDLYNAFIAKRRIPAAA